MILKYQYYIMVKTEKKLYTVEFYINIRKSCLFTKKSGFGLIQS